MILLLGASGYVGRAFAAELRRRGWDFQGPSRADVDYTRFEVLYGILRDLRPSFVINAAGHTGRPNVDACETARAETLLGNTLFPQAVAHACCAVGVPWGHVSSGCIYTGAKVLTPGGVCTEPDLMHPRVRDLVEGQPGVLRGFTEEEPPNFTFRSPPCSFYSGSKALAEEAILGVGHNYLWRLRIPFDEVDNARNYLSKVQRYRKAYQNINSISHRGDFVRACLDLWERRAPFGIYNITNPGHVSTREVVALIQRILAPARAFEFWPDDAAFYREAAVAPRSNCVLDVSKLMATGIRMRPVHEALEDALRRWQPENTTGYS